MFGSKSFSLACVIQERNILTLGLYLGASPIYRCKNRRAIKPESTSFYNTM